MTPLLLDVGELSGGCTDHALEYLHKTIADPPDSSAIWDPHPDPLLRQPVELFTRIGFSFLAEIQQAVRMLLRTLFEVRKARFKLDIKAIQAAIERLQRKPVQAWSAEDWMVVVDWLVAHYLPVGVIRTSAEYLAVRALIAARIKAQMPGAEPTKHFDALLPATLADLRRRGLLPPAQELLAEVALAHAAEAITQIGAQVKHRIKTLVLNHLSARASGQRLPWKPLEQALFDEFSILNRDWRRVAVTEAGEIQNQTLIAGLEPGTIVRRYEAYRDACPFCKKIHGLELTVVDPAKPDKDGWKEVWTGKTNVGRSASPRKREGDELVERDPDEMWWPAAGLQHPHCRGGWTVVGHAAADPKVSAFIDQLARKHGLAMPKSAHQ